MGYSLVPNKDVDNEANDAVGRSFASAFDRFRKPRPLTAKLMGVVGFAANTVIDLVTLPFNGKLGDWIDTSIKFLGYMMFSGIGGELLEAFMDFNALENLIIISRVQGENNQVGDDDSRRARTAFPSFPQGVGKSKFKDIMAYSVRYVRYATAAYGASMIDSADLLQTFGKKIVVPIVEGASQNLRIRKTCRYLNVKPEDILKMSNAGGNMNVVGHFIAVDRPRGKLRGAIVLAIRGTYTLSGVKTDAQLFSKEFCDGRAHAGIADSANALWKEVKEDIATALLDHPGYDLVITGHSLGAGTAALVALKLNYEGILAKMNASLKDVQIRCYAFAPPPVYYQNEYSQEIIKAMSGTSAFIHENDCVPFASADAVRRLSKVMVDVDNYPKGILGATSPLMAAGLRPIPEELKEIVMTEPKIDTSVDGAEPLAIPAPFVMWMRKVSEDESNGRPIFNTMFCRAKGEKEKDLLGTNDLNFKIDIQMVGDHMNPQYERAINSVRQQLVNKKMKGDGYVFPPKANPEEA